MSKCPMSGQGRLYVGAKRPQTPKTPKTPKSPKNGLPRVRGSFLPHVTKKSKMPKTVQKMGPKNAPRCPPTNLITWEKNMFFSKDEKKRHRGRSKQTSRYFSVQKSFHAEKITAEGKNFASRFCPVARPKMVKITQNRAFGGAPKTPKIDPQIEGPL